MGEAGLEHLVVEPVDLGGDGGGCAGRDDIEPPAAADFGHGGVVGVSDGR